MQLNSELDILLATARELVQAEDDAQHQITQLYAALVRSREALKRTQGLAQATARRLRLLARRQQLATPQALASAPELAALEALIARALATQAPRAPNVVLLREQAPPVAQNPASTLHVALREALGELDPRQSLVLTGMLGIDLTPGAPLDGRYPQDARSMAKVLGVSEDRVYLDFMVAAQNLREPARAARLRPHYEALNKRARGCEARLLRLIFEPSR